MSLAAGAASSHLKAMTYGTQNADVIHITKTARAHARKAPKAPDTVHIPAAFSSAATPRDCIYCGFESSPCEVSMQSTG